MRSLITGISGQDGYYLAHELNCRGDEVYGLVQPATNPAMGSERDLVAWESPFVKVELGDLTDFSSLSRIVKEVWPDQIYHLGAISSPYAGEHTPDLMMRVNTMGTLYLLEAIRGSAIRLVNAGSDSAYGISDPPQDDKTPLRPDTLYGASKAAAMMLVQAYRASYGVFACNAILFNHTSPRQSPFFLPRKVAIHAARVSQGKEDKPLQLGNLENRRDWSHAVDVVRAMMMILGQYRADDYAVGSGVSHSVRQLCEVAYKCVGLDYEKWVIGADEPPEQYRPKAQTGKLLEVGWDQKWSFKELVVALVQEALEE